MKRFFAFALAALAAMFVAACGGGGSSSALPGSVNVVAGDNTATVSWNMQPGIEYWIWYAAATFIDISGCAAQCLNVIPAASPTVVTGLTDGTTYSFTVNGHTNGGPGGPGTPSVSVIPRLAGGLDAQGKSTWSAKATLGSGLPDLRGVAYGVPEAGPNAQSLASATGAGIFVAVGNGVAFSATVSNVDGSLVWVAQNIPVNATLNAVSYNGSSRKFVAVGNNGTILQSTDGATWALQNSGTTDDLYAIASNGGEFIAVGANGAMLASGGGGTNWGRVGLPTTNALYAITYGNVNGGAATYVAAGASGTLLYSTNGGLNWQPGQPSSAPPDLKGVAFGAPQMIYSNTYSAQNPPPAAAFVAVGAGGAIFTSPNGINWTATAPIPGAATLNAVTYGHQFVAVGDGGSIVSSIDGVTWTKVRDYASMQPNLFAAIPALYVGGTFANQFVYSAMGANGANMMSK